MRWVVVFVVVAGLGTAAYFVFARKRESTQQTTARQDAAMLGAPRTVTGPAPELPPVTEKQEQDERRLIEENAKELALTDQEMTRVTAHLATMQEGRRKLFSDLAARAITVETVSRQLRELREAMNKSFETELGDERAKKLIERVRDAHAKSPQ